MIKIGIIGSGIFGTALALTASRAGNDVLCWDRKEDIIKDINNHKSKHFLDIVLPNNIRGTTEIEKIFKFADIILLSVSAQATREVLKNIKPYVKKETIIVFCAKGLEKNSGKMLSEIAEEILPQKTIAVLSGPGFASEISHCKPASVTIACPKEGIAKQISEAIGTKYFRPYTTEDIISPQIGGSVKNVIAIASGIIEGANLGDSARAALITRGIAEMVRLSKALGGNITTLMGMCGLGDLVLTANCKQSRNFSFGYEIGKAGDAAKALSENKHTVEGIHTCTAVLTRAQRLNVDMPICKVVNKILFEGISIETALEELISRPYKEEGF